MASLSEKLRRERELRGISLKQISEDTKIGVRFLEALEQDRLELIPGEFYRRSYLRAYARYLGLDEDRAVNAYAFANQEKPPEAETSPSEDLAAGMPAVGWLAIVGCILIVIALFYWRLDADGAEATAATSGEAAGAPAAVAAVSARAPSSEPPPTESPVPALVPGSTTSPTSDAALRLRVRVDESCWLEIRGDSEVLTTGLMDAGFESVFTANSELRLWLGNAGGVSLWLNGEPLGPLGSAGQVRKDIVITRDNYQDFVSGAGAS